VVPCGFRGLDGLDPEGLLELRSMLEADAFEGISDVVIHWYTVDGARPFSAANTGTVFPLVRHAARSCSRSALDRLTADRLFDSTTQAYTIRRPGDDGRSVRGLQYIRKIYEVEAESKKLELDADGRLALRKDKSMSVLDALFEWIVEIEPTLGKTSKLAEAVRYAINQRVFVERCFTDGRYEIDNGEIERVLKKPCVGRKNYLHCGSIEGARRLAAAYTLVLSCKGLGLNVNDYLVDVITKLADGWPLRRIRELVPDAWAAARAANSTPQPAGQ
jgi:hypothetical protein